MYKRRISAAPTSDPYSSDWLQPPLSQHGLRRFLQTIRERLRLVLIVFGIVLGAALIYLLTATKIYEAEADILVTPVPTQEAVLSTVGVIVQSTDPTLDVETATQLVDSPSVAKRAAESLDNGESADELLDTTSVAPIPESNILTVTAEGTSPELAVERANAFAEAAVIERREAIAANIDAMLPQLREDLSSATDAGTARALSETVAALTAFRAGGNASMQVETPATPPSSPSSPRTLLVLVGSLLVSIALGIGAVSAAQVLDPKLRREEQLRGLFSLPILARIPRERARQGPLTPERLSPMAREGYRTLRAAIAASEPGNDNGRVRSIMVGGSGPSEGKSTTAINLAGSLALAGNEVILIGADLRRPVVGKALGIKDEHGLIDVLLRRKTVAEALQPVPAYNNKLKLLVADGANPEDADLFSLPTATSLIEEGHRLADYVIIDSPPLADVADAIQLARGADAVLIVAQLGRSRINKLRELAELLASIRVRPIGFALIGVARRGRQNDSYYTSAQPRVSERKVARR